MKVAIQLFGHVRSYQQSARYLKSHITDLYDCDIFIHTWSEEDHIDPSWHKESNPSQAKNLTNEDKLKQIYTPKKIEIEDNSNIQYPGFFNSNKNILNRALKAMSHSQIRANYLRQEYARKNNIKYDLVIVLRPDVMPLAKLDLARFSDEFLYAKNSTIHFSTTEHKHVQGNKKISTPLATDLFYIANPDTLDKFFELKEKNFKRFYVDFSEVNKGGISAPEASFLEGLIQSGALPRIYEFPYAVIRTTGNSHLKANFSSIGDFERSLPIPNYLKEVDMENNKLLFSFVFKKLNNNKLEKIQKQIVRIKRQLDDFSDKLNKIKENR